MIHCVIAFIQIVGESLPISSSGHVDLVIKFLRRMGDEVAPLNEVANGLLHGPTSVIIAVFFRSRISFVLNNMRRCFSHVVRLMLLGFCATLPTILLYLLIDRLAVYWPLWLGFLISACMLISLRFVGHIYKTRITCVQASVIGVMQGLALLPGISRLGSTYVMARWFGIAPRTAFFFSITLEWPLITAAFLRSLHQSFYLPSIGVSMGCIVLMSLISYVVLIWAYKQALAKRWWVCGVYLLLPALLALIY